MGVPNDLVEPEARPFCYECHKPELTCVCGTLERVANRTLVWIVQHPRERFHSLGTARFAKLGLERVVVDAWHRNRKGPPPGAPRRPALLYPDKEAQPLGPSEGDEGPDALIVLDGTWSHAKRMVRDDPWLSSLPCYSLEAPEPSNYRIRKEPSLECISTIESIVHALSVLDGTPGLGGLLTAFATMIDEQIRLRDTATEKRLSTPRRRR